MLELIKFIKEMEVIKMPAWVGIMTAVIQILQSSGLLQLLIDLITKLVTQIAQGQTPGQAIASNIPAALKLYSKLPAEAQAKVDSLFV